MPITFSHFFEKEISGVWSGSRILRCVLPQFASHKTQWNAADKYDVIDCIVELFE